ncbi:MAG: tetratricopeptide repeat protein [Gemmatimonadetes bacterium]|nr:tetratricopeptide repeat protein [Gemmatimonadota bacterium]
MTGGRGETRARRLVRTLLPLVAVAVVGTGCATKRDIRDMRGDLGRMEARQDSIYQLLQQQNRAILDSLTVTTRQLLNVRGDLANQLGQLKEQLEQVGQLTGQVQVRLNQLDQQLTEAVRAVGTSGVTGGGGGGAAPAGGGAAAFDEARELYEIGVEQINRGNAMSARRAFQMVVDSFPTAEQAPEAQRQIGESYAMERNYDEATRAFDRVVERWQDSDAAPLALYRAGVIAQERGNVDRARQYFRRVISGYPNSDARGLAEEALRRLGG